MREITIIVHVTFSSGTHFAGPPVMSPFNFPANSQEGSRAQVTCSVTSGDLPIYISWLKDGEPLPSSLRVSMFFQSVKREFDHFSHIPCVFATKAKK